MNRKMIFATAGLIALAAPALLAQSSTPTTTTTTANPPAIADRKDNQQDRIANGVQDGQLTPGESKNLETKEAAINHEEHTMRTDDNGHLTAADRSKINNQQNHVSNRIYTDKHNAATAHYGNGEVGTRQQLQQDRIAQGVKSGQLTAGESARLEGQQKSINQEKSGMKAANGGNLTAGDKAVLNHRENNASKNIYAKKHNGKRS